MEIILVKGVSHFPHWSIRVATIEIHFFGVSHIGAHFFILRGKYIMICENNFCIYWEDDNCILDEISLNTFGCCEECICVNIEEEYLKIKRKELLDKYEKEAL